MEKHIILSADFDAPVRDLLKDDYEKIESKTEDGLEFIHLRKKPRKVEERPTYSTNSSALPNTMLV